jgi:hypothetical protein
VIEHGLIRVAAKPRFDLIEMVHAVQQVRPRDLGPLAFQGIAEAVFL